MIERSGSKNVGLIIPGTNNDRILKIAPGDNIPSAGLKYKEQIEMALIGNTVRPKKLVVAFSGVDHAEIDDALNALADENVSYAAVSTQTETVAFESCQLGKGTARNWKKYQSCFTRKYSG